MLAFMRQIRLAYPARRRTYRIQDNLSANWVPPIREFAAGNRIELVPTPTYARYLNPVECHFSALSQFVVCNADYLGRLRPRARRPRPLPQRRASRPTNRRRRSPTPHRGLMTLRVQPNFKGH